MLDTDGVSERGTHMTDYVHDLILGAFITPQNQSPFMAWMSTHSTFVTFSIRVN